LDFLLRKQISVSGSPTNLTFSQQSQAAVVSAGGIMCHTQPTPHTHKKRPHYVNTVDITNLRGAPALPFRKAPPQVHGNVLCDLFADKAYLLDAAGVLLHCDLL
jgi:hypothetical protein